MKIIFTLLVLCGLCLNTNAQELKNKIVLSIAPKATNVQFTVKLDGANKYTVNFGEGEGIKTFEKAAGEFIDTKYTFKTTKAQQREITINAAHVVTLRVTNSNAINGIKEIVSDKIKDLGFTSTKLDAYSSLNLSQCPNLVNAVFIGSNLETVKLPVGKTLESIQVSAAWNGEKKSLKEINLSDAEGLKSILITDAVIKEVDLTKQPNIETLCIYNPNKIGLRVLKGAKAMTKITRLNLNGNNLGYDQIPAKVVEEIPLEQFLYKQTFYYLAKDKISGTTLDLNHLLTSKGIDNKPHPTEFLFIWKTEDKNATWTNVPDKNITIKNGKYTFDPTPLNTNKFIVAIKMRNAGFPDVSKKEWYQSYNIHLVKGTTNGISTIATKGGVNFNVTAAGVQLYADTTTLIRIYNVNGQKIWEGVAPAYVPLQKGMYILSTANGNVKFVK